ncbi:hypothetical protein SAMN05421803_107155 [Nocardiopsis flavescens]|uniref:Uncharacterized protein n=1 Tax=Nocardiopsis flavescens TaxID=758803 RepID=A0A1M6KFJ1_9ACTN|nr:hypothetical protein [Nocardiopsis flavescens]SHJ57689.1 hypothetical protein SAMN05421803_107155 [Nocardiopsis flavescens]
MSEWQRSMNLLIRLNNELRILGPGSVIDSGLHGVDAPLLVVGGAVVQVRGAAFVVDHTDQFGDLVSRSVHPTADVRTLARALAD